MGLIHCRRHFAWLLLGATMLTATTRWRSASLPASFALFGAWHAIAFVAGLCHRRSAASRLAFVAAAAAVSAATAVLGADGARWAFAHGGGAGARLAVTLCCAPAAFVYLRLIRRLCGRGVEGHAALPSYADAVIPALCAAAVGAVLLGGSMLRPAAGLPPALAWWFALSGGVCALQRRAEPHSAKSSTIDQATEGD